MSRAVNVRVLHWVATTNQTYHEAGAGARQPNTVPSKRAQRRSAAVKEKVEFGRGSGRCAGFYRQYVKRADPLSEEAKEAARDQKRAQEAKDAKEASANRADRNRQERAEASGRHSEEQREQESRRKAAQQEGARRHERAFDFDKMRRSTWAEYEEAFTAFRQRVDDAQAFQVRDVPLPPKGHVVQPSATPEEWHRNLRTALLRWHPDKWARVEKLSSSDDERAQLKLVTEGMFRAVSRAKDRGFGHVRFPARSAQAWAQDD